MEQLSHKRSQFKDPFGRDPPPKAFYHPSRQKQLKKRDKKITLSPSRQDKKSSIKLTPEEDAFLKGSNSYAVRDTNKDKSDDSAHFEESWPHSERPSYSSVAESESQDLGTHHSMADALSYLKSTYNTHIPGAVSNMGTTKQDPPTNGSVLQSYIERFRHGAPMSREERSRTDICGKSGEFWWLSQSPPAPSDTSTPKDQDQPRSRKFTDQGRQGNIPLTKKTLQEFSHTMVDEDTMKLQARADRLLEDSLGSLRSSEPAVSTDGLGSTSCGTGSSVEEVAYRPIFTQYPAHSRHDTIPENRVPQPDIKVVRRSQKPEDDILYQWRLRRKMEVAQTGQGQGFKTMKSYTSKETDSKLDGFRRRVEGLTNGIPSSSLHFTPAPQKQDEIKVDAEVQTQRSSKAYMFETKDTCTETTDSMTKDFPSETMPLKPPPSSPPRQNSSNQEIASPTLPRKKEARTEPHLHLMCDLLPCPHAEDFSKRYSNDLNETFSDSSTPDGVRYKQYLQAEKPQSEEKNRRNMSADEDDQRISRNIDKGGKSRNKKEQGHHRNREDTYGKNSTRVYDGEHSTNNYDPNVHERKRVSWNKTECDSSSNSEFLGDAEPARGECEETKGDNSRCHSEGSNKGRQICKKGKQLQTAPRPVHSSSPGRPTVSSAIGQTISEHLFSGSTSAILSSVDSWASVTDQSQVPSNPVDQSNILSPPGDQSHSLSNQEIPSKDQTHRPHIPLSAGPSGKPASSLQQLDETCDSDGEFPDDHILKMLRQQRAEYEMKLRQIDDLLQQSSFGQH